MFRFQAAKMLPGTFGQRNCLSSSGCSCLSCRRGRRRLGAAETGGGGDIILRGWHRKNGNYETFYIQTPAGRRRQSVERARQATPRRIFFLDVICAPSNRTGTIAKQLKENESCHFCELPRGKNDAFEVPDVDMRMCEPSSSETPDTALTRTRTHTHTHTHTAVSFSSLK